MEIQDKIDTYLMGRMSERELTSFESELANNPKLQAEVDFQNDIISSIQDTKRLQLKQRLSSLETPPITTSSFGFKPWAIGVSLLSLSVLGGLVVWNMNNGKEISPTITEDKHITRSIIKPKNNIVTTEENSVVETITHKEVNNIIIEEEKPSIVENTEITKPVIADPSTLVPNPGGIDETEGIRNAGHENNMIDPLEQEDTHISTKLTPVVKQNKSMFHYQYDGDKLTLIGNFKSDTYTVYELTQQKNSPLYLKFKDNFYSLTNNNGKTKKLELVTNENILSELKSR